MGELVFVGLGLGPGGISQSGVDALAGCAKVFAETYTAPIEPEMLDRLTKLTGKDIVRLGRAEVEDGALILTEAERGSCCLIVPGDPMVATTHIDLRIRASERGIKTRIIHGASIGTAAAGLLGLQSYKFGRTTTLPFWRPGYEPLSPYESIEGNQKAGLHTLVLLDIDSEGEGAMTAGQGLELLGKMESRARRSVITPAMLVCVVARAGHEDALVRAGELDQLSKEDFGRPPHCIVIPGRLHYMESEALMKLAGAPRIMATD